VRGLLAAAVAFVVACAPLSAHSAGAGHGKDKKAKKADYREIVLPTGTNLHLELRSALASDASQVEDTVRARLRKALTVDGRTILPAGTQVVGYVTDVERAGRVSGRAKLALRFTVVRHDGEEYDMRTRTIEREAESTRGKDAATVGIGTGAGAVVGAVLGGGSGAATGAAIGAAAGTGTVLATKGEDVRLDVGTLLDTQLTAPLRVTVTR
jgi:ferric-dicitrate binding protein FerR (iron transport regulator)